MTNRSLSILVLAALVAACGSPVAAGTGGSGGIAGSGGSGGDGGSGGTGGEGGTGGDGGFGGAPTCEDQLARFAPCGGDIVGTWDISQVCTVPLTALGAILTSICPAATFSADPPMSTGTWTFNSDGTAARDSTLSLTGTINLPDACLNAIPGGGGAASCAALPTLASGAIPGIKLQCSYTSPNCACTIDVSQSKKDTVHYTVADGDVTITDDPATPKAAYCIVGDEMTVESDQKVTTQTVRAVLVLHR